MKSRRLKIPDDVKLKLWVLSGGRCEFPGCNRPVWRDGLTLKDDNFAHMAHLVAVSPNAARGDEASSPELATDFSNLMLVCFDHHKLIDGKHEGEYSLEFLREFKARHEERIQRQTAIAPEMGTTVVRFMARVRERKMNIPVSQAYDAIFPRFPADEKGIVLDFTNKEGAGDASHWTSFASDVDAQLRHALTPGNDQRRIEHLSVFAAAPIPLLMHLGNQIGGTIPVEIYQKHRNSDDWKWGAEPPGELASPYAIRRPLRSDIRVPQVAVLLSISGKVHDEEVQAVLPDVPRYELTVQNPSRDFLQYRSQLSQFSTAYRELMKELREVHGPECQIHLFPAVPIAIAVACGRELLPKADPRVHVYDLDGSRGFIRTLTVN